MGLLQNSGGARIVIQRTQIWIRCKKDPTSRWPGYLVLTERGKENIFFFSTRKLRQSDEVEIEFQVGSKCELLDINVQSCHDQVSSGRIMRESPGADNPFPAKFYFRCYAQILKVTSKIETTDTVETAPLAAPAEVVPEIAAAPIDAPIEQQAA